MSEGAEHIDIGHHTSHCGYEILPAFALLKPSVFVVFFFPRITDFAWHSGAISSEMSERTEFLRAVCPPCPGKGRLKGSPLSWLVSPPKSDGPRETEHDFQDTAASPAAKPNGFTKSPPAFSQSFRTPCKLLPTWLKGTNVEKNLGKCSLSSAPERVMPASSNVRKSEIHLTIIIYFHFNQNYGRKCSHCFNIQYKR